MANYNQNLTVAGLGTTTILIPTSDIYTIKGTLTLPTLTTTSGVGQSAVVVTVNQNGSPIYTGPAGSEGFSTGCTAAANDSITIVLTSAAAIDLPPNSVKMTVSIWEGAL